MVRMVIEVAVVLCINSWPPYYCTSQCFHPWHYWMSYVPTHVNSYWQSSGQTITCALHKIQLSKHDNSLQQDLLSLFHPVKRCFTFGKQPYNFIYILFDYLADTFALFPFLLCVSFTRNTFGKECINCTIYDICIYTSHFKVIWDDK